ncbi:MAG: hypothetical protein IKH90_02840 [Ruminococcus sp.]|nr:hypothetical protein [Ruminococcus sp.]
MADNDIIDWEQMYVLIDELGLRGYKFQHFDVCKKIWDTKVPDEGQADTLQGELLREIEKLRTEAMDNGNVNWDDNFAFFCDNIKQTFEKSGLFDKLRLDNLSRLLEFIKQCGEYAGSYAAGEISDDDADPARFAYVDDDLYDYICDAVADFALGNPTDIPNEKKDFIYR